MANLSFRLAQGNIRGEEGERVGGGGGGGGSLCASKKHHAYKKLTILFKKL